MIWIAVIAVFAIIFFREEHKKKKDPEYRSWLDSGSHWDQWNKKRKE